MAELLTAAMEHSVTLSPVVISIIGVIYKLDKRLSKIETLVSVLVAEHQEGPKEP